MRDWREADIAEQHRLENKAKGLSQNDFEEPLLARSLESACAGLGQGRQPYHDPDSRQHRALHKEQQRDMQELQRGKVQQDRGWQVRLWQSPSHLQLPALQRQCLLPASPAVRAPLVTNQRHQQGEGPSLSPSWGALSWPSARTHQIPKYKQCGICRFGGGIQAAVFIVHFAALCVAEAFQRRQPLPGAVKQGLSARDRAPKR